MTLPDNLEKEFWQEYTSFEESKRMKYVTSVEKIGIRKGLLQGIDLGLQLKFSTMQAELFEEISQILDVQQLEAILTVLKTVNTVEELRQVYQPITE